MERFWPRNRALAIRFGAVLSLVTLLFGPYLANLLRTPTRYLYGWQQADALLLLGLMGALAVLAVGADAILARLRWTVPRRLYHHLFVLAFGAGVLANVTFYWSNANGWHVARTGLEIQTLWLLLVATVVWAYARPGTRLVRCCRALCLILLPVVPIVGLQLLAAKTYRLARDPLPSLSAPEAAAAGGEAVTPIYLFIFDEWSYERTFTDGAARTAFPDLAALTQESALFTQAHAPGKETDWSMPCLLYQTRLRPVADHSELGFTGPERMVRPEELECLFDAVPADKYRRIIVGSYLPYGSWLEGHVDACRTYCYYPQGLNLTERLAVHGLNALSYWTDPWSVWLTSRVERPLREQQLLRMRDGTRADTLEVLVHQPLGTCALFHHLIPHWPTLQDADGRYLGSARAVWDRGDPRGYLANLARLDHLVGEFMTALKQAGRFDPALIILTSDHSWRFDPDRIDRKDDSPVTHVPLIVKLPHQAQGMRIDSHFENCDLGRLIRFALSTDVQPQQLAAWVQAPGITSSTPRRLGRPLAESCAMRVQTETALTPACAASPDS